MAKTLDQLSDDIRAVRADVAELRKEHGQAIGDLRADVTDLRADVDVLRSETHGNQRTVSGELKAIRAELAVLTEQMVDLQANQLTGAQLKAEFDELRNNYRTILSALLKLSPR